MVIKELSLISKFEWEVLGFFSFLFFLRLVKCESVYFRVRHLTLALTRKCWRNQIHSRLEIKFRDNGRIHCSQVQTRVIRNTNVSRVFLFFLETK